MRYYKKKYAIGIYNKITENQTDELKYLFTSVEEMSKFIKKSIDNTYVILGQHFNGSKKDIVIDRHLYELHFINMVDDY